MSPGASSLLAAAVPGLVRSDYIATRAGSHFTAKGELPTIPALPAVLPAPAAAEVTGAALLAAP